VNDVSANEPQPKETDKTLATSALSTSRESKIGRTLPIPTRKQNLGFSVVAAVTFLFGFTKGPFGPRVGIAIGFGLFVFALMSLVAGVRRAIRPDVVPDPAGASGAADASGASGAAKGGWANPTKAQKFGSRMGRMQEGMFPSKRRRR
jgi:hypothetical protein